MQISLPKGAKRSWATVSERARMCVWEREGERERDYIRWQSLYKMTSKLNFGCRALVCQLRVCFWIYIYILCSPARGCDFVKTQRICWISSIQWLPGLGVLKGGISNGLCPRMDYVPPMDYVTHGRTHYVKVSRPHMCTPKTFTHTKKQKSDEDCVRKILSFFFNVWRIFFLLPKYLQGGEESY